MTSYIDSSVLVGVYVTERFSTSARRAIRDVAQVPYTQLHELEVPNAFELSEHGIDAGLQELSFGESRELRVAIECATA